MKVSIIPFDSVVCIDGICINGIDLSQIPSEIHAVQWRDNEGTIEYMTQNKVKPQNQDITSFEQFNWVIDAWNTKKVEIDAEIARQIAEETQV